MRLSELILHLQQRIGKHGDVDVVVVHGGSLHSIDPDNLYLSRLGWFAIDADDNVGKTELQASDLGERR